MSNDVMNKLDFNIVVDSRKKFLVLKLSQPEMENLIDYQVHMISSNRRNNIVPFEICRKDNDSCLYYDITGLISLEKFINTCKLEKQAFIKLLNDIADSILNNKDLLLFENSYIFSDQYFYVNPETHDVCAVYVPISRDVNYSSVFKEFIINIFAKAQFDNLGENGDLLARVLALIKKQDFNMYDFKLALNCMKSDDFQYSYTLDEKMFTDKDGLLIKDKLSKHDVLLQNEAEEKSGVLIKKDEIQEKGSLNFKSKHHEQCNKEIFKMDRVISRNIANNEGITEIKDKAIINNRVLEKHVDKEGASKRAPLLMAAALQVAVICWSVVLERVLQKNMVNSILRYSIIAMLIILIDIIIFKFLIINKRTKNKQASIQVFNEGGHKNVLKDDVSIMSNIHSTKDSPKVCSDNAGYIGKDESEIIMSEKLTDTEMYAPKSNAEVVPEDRCRDHQVYQSSNRNYEETTLLAPKSKICAYLLQDGEDNKEMKYRIEEEEYFIGRNPDICSLVIDEKTIGRVHAKIQFKEKSFFLTDRGSINGTVLNGKKVESGTEYKLDRGDSIEFANIKYSFIC